MLPYNLARRTVVLVKQFRYPAYVNGYDDLMIEAAAGLLDNALPEERIRAEAEEETGYRLGEIRKVFEVFMSSGSVTEKIHFFIAEYEPSMRVSAAEMKGLRVHHHDVCPQWNYTISPRPSYQWN